MSDKIKIYIVTYNNSKALNDNLESLFANVGNNSPEVNIINNHPNFHLEEKFKNKVNIFHNSLRISESTGYLSYDWNSAIINGFRDLNLPDARFVILIQDDTILYENFLDILIDLHHQKKYTFIQAGIGDNLMFFSVEAIKNIGLFDLNYSHIAYHESDFFLRALLYNREFSSINDHEHKRLLNPLPEDIKICERSTPVHTFSEAHQKAFEHHPLMANVFREKWGELDPNNWTDLHYNLTIKKPLINCHMHFPYFQKNCYDLAEKGYILP